MQFIVRRLSVMVIFIFIFAAMAGPIGAATSSTSTSANRNAVQSCGVVPLDIELVIDRSGSMQTEQSAGQPRIYWAKLAAKQLVDSLDANGGVGGAGQHRFGVTSFGGTTATVHVALGTSSAAGTVKAAIDGISAGNNTPLKTGMAKGAGDLNAGARNPIGGAVSRILILMSDGRPIPDGPVDGGAATTETSQRPTQQNIDDYLASADVAYSIAIGAGGKGSGQVDLGLMQLLDKPDGHYYNVVDASDLVTLFGDIITEISCPEPTPTAPPDPTPTAPPDPTPTAPPEPTPTAPPEPTPTAPPTAAPTSNPTGEVFSETLPPTDAAPRGGDGNANMSLVLMAIAALVAITLVLTPTRRQER
jgi:hypothetical protein